MPKRKQQAPPSSESEEPEASGSEPAASDSSSDDSDEFPSGAEDSGSESSDDEAGEAFEQIDVDFGFFCPQEKDFQGLRTLLQNYLDGQQWACSDLADAIIRQARGGCPAMLRLSALGANVETNLRRAGQGRMHVPSCRRRAAAPPPPAAAACPLPRTLPPTLQPHVSRRRFSCRAGRRRGGGQRDQVRRGGRPHRRVHCAAAGPPRQHQAAAGAERLPAGGRRRPQAAAGGGAAAGGAVVGQLAGLRWTRGSLRSFEQWLLAPNQLSA